MKLEFETKDIKSHRYKVSSGTKQVHSRSLGTTTFLGKGIFVGASTATVIFLITVRERPISVKKYQRSGKCGKFFFITFYVAFLV